MTPRGLKTDDSLRLCGATSGDGCGNYNIVPNDFYLSKKHDVSTYVST